MTIFKIEKKRISDKYSAAFEKLKNNNSQQIAEILINFRTNQLLTISGGIYNDEDINECEVAFAIAMSMLKNNNITLDKKYME